MNNLFFKLGFIAFISILFIECNKDDDSGQTNTDIDLSEAEQTAKVDSGVEVLSDITLQGFEDTENPKKGFGKPFLPDCAKVTVELTSNSKKVTIDFGTEGCKVKSGHILKGKIIMDYSKDTDVNSLVINYTLENFFIDDVQLKGSKSIKRVRKNDNENPEFTMDIDLKIIFANGTEITRKGNKVREWIEGVFNGNWEDNIFLITGEWETTFANGAIHSSKITTPLRRLAICRWFVSGVIELKRSNYKGTLDYGNGECDDKAIFTSANGEEKEIKL